MIFRELTQGATLYMLHKADMTISEGIISDVSKPHLENYNPMRTAQMLVDVTAMIDGVQKTFVTPESLSVTYASDTIVCADKESLMREIKTMKAQSEDIVNNFDAHKERITKCDTLLADLSPEIKEKKQTEERFAKLEDALANITKMMEKLVN